MNNYKYDIAISLCSRDLGFAKQLKSHLNPKLNIFMYEESQEDLITKNAMVTFTNVFKKQARLVVILYREEWGDSTYTGLEQDAITDRYTKEKNMDFLFLVTLEKGQSPAWYSKSRIYADPFNYSIEKIASFIEFKLVDIGGLIKPITFEDNIQLLHKKFEHKRSRIEYLKSKKSLNPCIEELEKLKTLFNSKIEFLNKQNTPYQWGSLPIYSNQGELSIKNYSLKFVIESEEFSRFGNTNSQSFTIAFQIEITNNSVELYKWYRFNTDMQYNYGWSEGYNYIVPPELRNQPFVFSKFIDQSNKQFYDLREIQSSEVILEYWLKELFQLVETDYYELFNTPHLDSKRFI